MEHKHMQNAKYYTNWQNTIVIGPAKRNKYGTCLSICRSYCDLLEPQCWGQYKRGMLWGNIEHVISTETWGFITVSFNNKRMRLGNLEW